MHGSADHITPERITPALLTVLQASTSFDPLHMPANLAPVRAIAIARPGLPQVVCFDTVSHHTLPLVARGFALPRAITDAGVRRYGFHGLSLTDSTNSWPLRPLPRPSSIWWMWTMSARWRRSWSAPASGGSPARSPGRWRPAIDGLMAAPLQH